MAIQLEFCAHYLTSTSSRTQTHVPCIRVHKSGGGFNFYNGNFNKLPAADIEHEREGKRVQQFLTVKAF